MSRSAKDCQGEGATHFYGCFCREEHFRTENIRMIRAFQEIQKLSRFDSVGIGSCYERRIEIDRICREAIAPREK